jgi:hypothetical protein
MFKQVFIIIQELPQPFQQFNLPVGNHIRVAVFYQHAIAEFICGFILRMCSR